MGRKDNLEIFEDTQRMYSSNESLISAVKHSSAAQDCFVGSGLYWYSLGHRIYQKQAKIIVSQKRTLESAAPYAYAGKKGLHSEFCLCNQSGRRRDQRLVCTGRSYWRK